MRTVYERQKMNDVIELKDVGNSIFIEDIVQEDLMSVRLQRKNDEELSLENILRHKTIEHFMSKAFCTYEVKVHDFDYGKQQRRASGNIRETEEGVFNDGPLYRSLSADYSTIHDEHVPASPCPPTLPPRPPRPPVTPSELRRKRLVNTKSESDMPKSRICSSAIHTPPARPKLWLRCHHGKMTFAGLHEKLQYEKEGSFLVYTSETFKPALAFVDSKKAVKTLDIVWDSKGYYLKHKVCENLSALIDNAVGTCILQEIPVAVTSTRL